MHDLLSDQRFVWQGHWHYVQLDPWNCPAHIFSVVPLVHNERDLDQLS
jgi:starch synthase (maltosyl-transferring)